MVLAITNARALCPGPESGRIDTVEQATLLVEAGRITSLSSGGPVPAGARFLDAAGRIVTPGLVDCHTHAWFLGDRAREFGERVSGVSYLDIARKGGGIQSTVRATRAGSSAERTTELRRRLRRLAENGVTTVEVKSGYGLSVASELAALEEIGSLTGTDLPDLMPTLLAAHAVPPEVDSPAAREAWMREITQTLIPEVALRKLAGRVDVFVESGAYTTEEARRIAAAARSAGLALHLHVDQLTDGEGASLAASLGAQAAGHLERVSEAGIRALKEKGVVAVLLPTATLVAGAEAVAPARRLIEDGVAIALSTNLNPGTGPTESTSLMFFLAAVGLRMSPEEILWSSTRGGALALGLTEVGRLEPGARADLVIWDAQDFAHLPYHAGINHVRQVFRAGELIVDRSGQSECDGRL
jgi:imidazolonepropionase